MPSDLNSPSPARFTLSAHDGAVSALDVNPHIRGCLLTGGTDKQVKVWNISENEGKRYVSLVTSRDLDVVRPFSLLCLGQIIDQHCRAKSSQRVGLQMTR